jgi:hypothetical protein
MPCKLRQIYTNKLQLVHLRLSVKSASQPANNVFSLTKNQPAVLSASQISPGEHLIRIIRCTWRSTHPWSFSHDILCHVPCLSGVSNHIALWDKICCNKFRHDSFACDSWEMQDKTKDHHPVRLDLSAESAAIHQCFSLTTNQRTVLSATINQRNEQGACMHELFRWVLHVSSLSFHLPRNSKF